MNPPRSFAERIDRAIALFAIVLLLAGAAVCVQPECFPTQDQRLLRRTIEALAARRPDSLPLAREYMDRSGSGPLSIALAADAAAVNFQHHQAIGLYRRLPEDHGRWQFHANVGIARRYEALGRLTEQERYLRRALEVNEFDIDANSRLSHLLQVTGRSWEGIPLFFMQIRRGKCRGDELLGLASPERFFRSDDRLLTIGRDANPDDVLYKLADARRELFDNRQASAETLFRQVLEVAPQLGEAQGRLGRIIYDRGDPDEFLQWRAALPNEARDHPEVWFVQGMQARRLGQLDGAVRCFLETLNRSPNHLSACIQIAGCLDQMGRDDLAKEFVRQGEILASLESLLNIIRSDMDSKLMHKAVNSFADAGRFWEAAGWAQVLTNLYDVDRQAVRRDVRKWLEVAKKNPTPNAIQFLPASKLRTSDFAEPRWTPSSGHRSTPPTSPTPDAIAWKFQDDASRVGIRFQYYEGTSEANRLSHIFNVVGGGMAATDFDRDGWCDLYLAQANNWRDPAVQPDYPDRMFRNVAGERFADVTALTGLGDLSFTHGIAAGDFDQDGFPDLYLGNLGANRLYRNNGDGTFTDVTPLAEVAGNEWTTSSVFADFNGDGLPDLYVANYSLMEETTRRICKRSNGDEMACTPDVLTAEFHRFYVNLGDGRFRDVTKESGMHQPNGRGLGLVAWDFNGDGKLGVFVANDTTANFLFSNTGTDAEGVPSFVEDGVIRGVAFDVDGSSQASMGVAAGDINGDGMIDMYITNFFGESDTLYSQRSDRLFDDATRPYDLRDAGFWTLGFGTQFMDFDGDGWEDIVATNGHVDQQSRRGDPDRTPPQLFRNLQGRKFVEIVPQRLGPFFQRGWLGRGLAKLDWNRDGRTDFAVSHLHDDFALVTNQTPFAGRPLVVRLMGRTGARDPIGATVRLRAGRTEQYRLATGGDGYLVTNDHFLHFAVPAEQLEVELEVRWPHGKVERWHGIHPDQEVLLIEGRKQHIQLRAFTGADEEHSSTSTP